MADATQPTAAEAAAPPPPPPGDLAQQIATQVDKLVARWKSERGEVPSAADTTDVNLLREDILIAAMQLAEQAQGRAQAEADSDKKLRKAQDEVLRAKADFLNYQDRQKREFSRMLATTMRGFVEALIPWMDNFELSLTNAAANTSADGHAHFRDAMQLTHDHLLQVLAGKNLKRFSAAGKRFDPGMHESVTKIPAPDKFHQEVIEEIRPGYTYQDLIVRPAGVVIADNPGNPYPADPADPANDSADGDAAPMSPGSSAEEPLKD